MKLCQKRQHLLEHRRIELGRGVVVEVDDFLWRDHFFSLRRSRLRAKITPPSAVRCPRVLVGNGYSENTNCADKSGAAGHFATPRPNHGDRLKNKRAREKTRVRCIPKTRMGLHSCVRVPTR